MFKSIIALSLFASTNAFALGGFYCHTADSRTIILGNSGSTGVWVTEVAINGKEYPIQENDAVADAKNFTAEQIYVSDSVFNFKIMDGEQNRTLLQVETVKRDSFSAGLSWQPGVAPEDKISSVNDLEVTQPIQCEFTY
jgi:hypothetical protein